MKRTEDILSEDQAGFRPGTSTVDQLFAKSPKNTLKDRRPCIDAMWILKRHLIRSGNMVYGQQWTFFIYPNKIMKFTESSVQYIPQCCACQWRLNRLVCHRRLRVTGMCSITPVIQYTAGVDDAVCKEVDLSANIQGRKIKQPSLCR